MANTTPYAFDEQSATRIANVVRRFRPINQETLPRELARLLAKGFWVKITDSEQDDDDNWRHKGSEVFKARTGANWDAAPDARVADGGTKGIWIYSESGQHFPNDTVVFVVPLRFLTTAIDDPDDGSEDSGDAPNAAAMDETEEWWALGGGGASVDVLNNGTNVVSASPYINIPTTNGSNNVLKFATSTIGGKNGADLELQSGSSAYQGIYWNGSAFVIDWLRAHA